MSLKDWVEDFSVALEAAIAAKYVIAMGGWYLIPVAAILSFAMHNAGEAGEPSSRQVSLYATEIVRRYPKYSKVRRKGRYYLKYR
jgi:hypothetical protein